MARLACSQSRNCSSMITTTQLSLFDQTLPTRSSAEIIAALSTAAVGGHSYEPSTSKRTKRSPGSGMMLISCAVCSKQVMRYICWMKRVNTPTCSKKCNGTLRCKTLIPHAHKARAAWTADSLASYREKMTGPRNPAWRGGVTLRNAKGNYKGARYVRCPPEFKPMARRDGYVMEHRLMVARAIGRLLTRTEVVHHVNHDSTDNRLENLMLFACNKDHKLYEWTGSPLPVWQP